MRHLQFSTTCCFASQTAQAVKTLLVSVSVCVRLCVSVYKSEDVGKVNRERRKQHPRNVATHDRRPSQDLRCLACDSRHKNSDSAIERERGERQEGAEDMKGNEKQRRRGGSYPCMAHSNWALKSPRIGWTEVEEKQKQKTRAGKYFWARKIEQGGIFYIVRPVGEWKWKRWRNRGGKKSRR